MMYRVQIRRIGTDEVIKQSALFDEKKAERVERGMLINMNRDEFYTEIVPDDEPECPFELCDEQGHDYTIPVGNGVFRCANCTSTHK